MINIKKKGKIIFEKGKIKNEVLKDLILLLDDKNEDVVKHAAYAISNIIEYTRKCNNELPKKELREVFDCLIKLVLNPSIRDDVADALYETISFDNDLSRDLWEQIILWLSSSNTELKVTAIYLMAESNVFNDKLSLEALVYLNLLLKDENQYIRYRSQIAIINIINSNIFIKNNILTQEGVKYLQVLLKEETYEVINIIENIAIKIKDSTLAKEILLYIIPLLKSKDKNMRKFTIEALRNVIESRSAMGDMLEYITPLLKDTDEDVRAAVVLTIGRVLQSLINLI